MREAVEKALREKEELDDNYQLHLYALFLLEQFQDTASFMKIIELVSLPPDTVYYLIRDTITSGLSDILYTICILILRKQSNCLRRKGWHLWKILTKSTVFIIGVRSGLENFSNC